MSYIGKNVAPQPQGTYSQSEIDTQMLTKSNSTDMTTALALKANLVSPTFTGTPTAPTPTAGDNSTKLATTEFVNSEITNDVGVANSSLVKTALNASGSAPIYACRAWVNFNGTDTVAIRASGNVSSITDNGTGDYTVNFATAMVDVNYSATGICDGESTCGMSVALKKGTLPSTNACNILTDMYSQGKKDSAYVYISIFR